MNKQKQYLYRYIYLSKTKYQWINVWCVSVYTCVCMCKLELEKIGGNNGLQIILKKKQKCLANIFHNFVDFGIFRVLSSYWPS